MKQFNFRPFLIVISFFALGLFAVLKYSDQIINARDIASLNQNKINTQSILNETNLKNELTKKIKIYTLAADKEKIIALDGFSSQICKTFPQIEIYFEAYGVIVSGESTQFKVSADCLPAQDPAEIAVIKIPYEKILKEKPRNAQFKFSGYAGSFEFINSDTEWSRTWVLSKIIFKSENASKVVKMDSSINDRSDFKPVVLEF